MEEGKQCIEILTSRYIASFESISNTSNEARLRERSDRGCFVAYYIGKKSLFLHTAVRTGFHRFNYCRLSVVNCLSAVLSHYRGLWERFEADFYKPGIYRRSRRVWANAWDVLRRTPSQGGRDRRSAVMWVVCFKCGRDLVLFSFIFLGKNARPAASMKPALPHLPL